MAPHFVHATPATRVVFGAGSRRDVVAEAELLGAKRVLLLGGGHESGVIAEIADALGSRLAGTFDEIVMHVPAEVAGRAVRAAQDAHADLLVPVGGGSAVGTAKAIAKELGTPILAVATTYAGSEMTPIWGLTENARKVTGRDLRVLPETVIYDPELTLTLPAGLSANSGMNALAHLVEGLYAPNGSPISALTAAEGVRALSSALPRVVGDLDDVDARSDALYGAWLGGWILGTTGMGVHHKICHALGGTFDTPHAQTHSAVLPYATAFNAEAAPEAMDRIVRALEEAGRPTPDAATGLWQLATDIGANTSLRALDLPESALDEIVTQVVDTDPVNPRRVDGDGVRELLAQAYAGAPPTPIR